MDEELKVYIDVYCTCLGA